METTLTPLGFFSFSIPKPSLVQWVDLLPLLLAPWLPATAGKRAAQAISKYQKMWFRADSHRRHVSQLPAVVPDELGCVEGGQHPSHQAAAATDPSDAPRC